MRKYWAFFRIKFQNFTAYRGNMMIMIIGNTLTVVVLLSVAFASPAKFVNSSFDRSELIFYYIAGLFLQWATLWYPFYAIQRDIKNGTIVGQVLIKPVSLFWSKFFEEFSWHSISALLGLVVCAIIGVFLMSNINLTIAPNQLILFAFATCLAAFLVFSMSLCMGMLAFWLTHINAVDSVFWAARAFLAGQIIPMAFFPSFAQNILTFLPFRYTFSFPLEILLSKSSPSSTYQGFIIGIVWLIFFVLIYKIMLPRGIRAYASFGS